MKFLKEILNYKMQTTASVHTCSYKVLFLSCYPHVNNKSVIHFTGLLDHKVHVVIMFVVHINLSLRYKNIGDAGAQSLAGGFQYYTDIQKLE